MNDYLYRAFGLSMVSLLLLLSPALAIAQETPGDTSDCAGYDEAAQHALALMGQNPRPIKAGKDGVSPPQVKIGETSRIDLLPQTEVAFLMPPGRHTLAEGSAAGVVQFTTGSQGRYRINISDGSWLDVISSSGQLLEAEKFNGRHQCQPLRKYVEYVLPANTLHTLQFSGGSKMELILAITKIE